MSFSILPEFYKTSMFKANTAYLIAVLLNAQATLVSLCFAEFIN